MRKHLPYLMALTILLWLSITTLLYADANLPMPTTALPQWENLLATSPFALITGIIVKWFMNHIDQKDRTFFEALAKKDEAFSRLAEQCHVQLQQYGREVAETLKESIATINKIIEK